MLALPNVSILFPYLSSKVFNNLGNKLDQVYAAPHESRVIDWNQYSLLCQHRDKSTVLVNVGSHATAMICCVRYGLKRSCVTR